MEDRAHLIDGSLTVDSGPGEGTVVRLTVPFLPGNPPIGRQGVAAHPAEGR